MKAEFFLDKSIHMYNHQLSIKSKGECYSAIIEDSPVDNKTMLIWLDEFELPMDSKEDIKGEMINWFDNQGYGLIFNEGRRVRSHIRKHMNETIKGE